MIKLKPVTRLKMKAISHVWNSLTEWERRFMTSIENRFHLTYKQKSIVDQLYLERVKGEFTGTSNEVDYGDQF